MKIRTLAITAIALSILTATGIYIKNMSLVSTEVDPLVGTTLLSTDLIEKTHQLLLSQGGDEVILIRTNDDDWIISSLFNLPVDISKLQTLISSLTDADINRKVTSNPERLKRLQLDQGTLALLDKSDKKLFKITLGKTINNQSTTFIFDERETAYSMSATPSFDTSSLAWTNKILYYIDPKSIAGIQFILTDSSWSVRRDENDKPWISTTPNDDRIPLQEPINRVLTQISTQRFTAVSSRKNQQRNDPLELDKDFSRTLKITLFTGETITLTLSQQQVSDENPEGPSKTWFSISSSQLDNPINKLMNELLFETSAYSFDAIPADLSVISKMPPPSQEPEASPEEILANMEEIPNENPDGPVVKQYTDGNSVIFEVTPKLEEEEEKSQEEQSPSE